MLRADVFSLTKRHCPLDITNAVHFDLIEKERLIHLNELKSNDLFVMFLKLTKHQIKVLEKLNMSPPNGSMFFLVM